jgi:hypothetical protein
VAHPGYFAKRGCKALKIKEESFEKRGKRKYDAVRDWR